MQGFLKLICVTHLITCNFFHYKTEVQPNILCQVIGNI